LIARLDVQHLANASECFGMPTLFEIRLCSGHISRNAALELQVNKTAHNAN
jgi:hypothetical protein